MHRISNGDIQFLKSRVRMDFVLLIAERSDMTTNFRRQQSSLNSYKIFRGCLYAPQYIAEGTFQLETINTIWADSFLGS